MVRATGMRGRGRARVETLSLLRQHPRFGQSHDLTWPGRTISRPATSRRSMSCLMRRRLPHTDNPDPRGRWRRSSAFNTVSRVP